MRNNILLQVGVKVLLKNKNNQYLLLRRSSEKYPGMGGVWDIAGGRIDAGKTLLENRQREVFEETGLELLEGAPKLLAAQDILEKPGYHVVRLTYFGKADGEVKLDLSEHDLYRWYTWEEVLQLDNVDSYFKELLNNRALWINIDDGE